MSLSSGSGSADLCLPITNPPLMIDGFLDIKEALMSRSWVTVLSLRLESSNRLGLIIIGECSICTLALDELRLLPESMYSSRGGSKY